VNRVTRTRRRRLFRQSVLVHTRIELIVVAGRRTHLEWRSDFRFRTAVIDDRLVTRNSIHSNRKINHETTFDIENSRLAWSIFRLAWFVSRRFWYLAVLDNDDAGRLNQSPEMVHAGLAGKERAGLVNQSLNPRAEVRIKPGAWLWKRLIYMSSSYYVRGTTFFYNHRPP
jgi:hypothetical protein